MFLPSYGMFFVGVALGGVVLLAIFSMLAMARKQDDDQDRLRVNLDRENSLALLGDYEATPEDIRLSVSLDLKEGGATKS